MVSNKRSGHEASICEISKLYPLQFKKRSKVKVKVTRSKVMASNERSVNGVSLC